MWTCGTQRDVGGGWEGVLELSWNCLVPALIFTFANWSSKGHIVLGKIKSFWRGEGRRWFYISEDYIQGLKNWYSDSFTSVAGKLMCAREEWPELERRGSLRVMPFSSLEGNLRQKESKLAWPAGNHSSQRIRGMEMDCIHGVFAFCRHLDLFCQEPTCSTTIWRGS